MNSGTIDRRELTFKALAGLVGGALGWLPVEIANHGRSLTEAASTGQQIGEFVSMALMAGAMGGTDPGGRRADAANHAANPAPVFARLHPVLHSVDPGELLLEHRVRRDPASGRVGREPSGVGGHT